MYIKRLASNEIFSPSNKIHREVGRAKDLSAPLHNLSSSLTVNTVSVIKTNGLFLFDSKMIVNYQDYKQNA